MTAPRFSPGDRVRLRANPARVGLVHGEPVPYAASFANLVFFSADDIPGINETDLEPAPGPRLQVLPREAFLRARLELSSDSGARRVLVPSENKRDPADVVAVPDRIQPVFSSDPLNAAISAMALE